MARSLLLDINLFDESEFVMEVVVELKIYIGDTQKYVRGTAGGT